MGVLDNKVVLVTGGARGIGRECALIAAKQGAKVIVNDLGGSVEGGDTGDASPAEQVVEEIRKNGGEADANSDTIAEFSGAKNMITQALDRFGGLHAIISPAGILRDKMFHKMSEEDWDAVINVHLKGSFNICRNAIELFREQQEGSFVLFTSTSGIIGNIGQANYAAAKMGIAGLSRIIAMEGALKNVRSNVIAPFAWTRMIATIPIKDEEQAKRMERSKQMTRADQVAQIAVGLSAPACKLSGQILVARGNEVVMMSQSRPLQNAARIEGWTPESLLSHGFPAISGTAPSLEQTGGVFNWEAV